MTMTDKLAAERAFLLPPSAVQQMKRDAETIEMLNKALLLLSLEFVLLARPQAVEAMEGFRLFRDRISKNPLTIAAEMEAIANLDHALTFYADGEDAA